MDRDVFFAKAGKLRWSFKHDRCVVCKTIDFKHKGRGLCTSCRGKEQEKKMGRKRKQQKRQAWLRWEARNKDTERARKLKAQKAYYQKNKEALCIIQKVRRRVRAGKTCMSLNVNGKQVLLPFESIDTPKQYKGNEDKYELRNKKLKQIDILRTYYEKRM